MRIPSLTINQVADLLQCEVLDESRLSNGMTYKEVQCETFELRYTSFTINISLWSGERCTEQIEGVDPYDSSFDYDEDYFVIDVDYVSGTDRIKICNYDTVMNHRIARECFIELLQNKIAQNKRRFAESSDKLLQCISTVHRDSKQGIEKIAQFTGPLGYKFDPLKLKFTPTIEGAVLPTIDVSGTSMIRVIDRNSTIHYNWDDIERLQRRIMSCIEYEIKRLTEVATQLTKVMQ